VVSPPRLPTLFGFTVVIGTNVAAAVGCAQCARTGYRGQVPVAEVLSVTPGLRALLDGDPTDAEIE